MKEPSALDKMKAKHLFIDAKKSIEEHKDILRMLDHLVNKYLENDDEFQSAWEGFGDYICNEDYKTFLSEESLNGLVESLFSVEGDYN